MTRRIRIIRWVARVWSLVSLAFVLLILIGELVSPTEGLPISLTDAIGMAFFPTGVLIGMALGWWLELAGGIVGVASLAAFYLFLTVAHGRVPGGPFFALVAAPAALFLLAGWLKLRAGGSPGAVARSEPKRDLETEEGALDEALEETFPASDPISISPHPRRGTDRRAEALPETGRKGPPPRSTKPQRA